MSTKCNQCIATVFFFWVKSLKGKSQPEKDNGLKSLRFYNRSQLWKQCQSSNCCIICPKPETVCADFFSQREFCFWAVGYLTTQLIYSSINQPKELLDRIRVAEFPTGSSNTFELWQLIYAPICFRVWHTF